jgi:hypothetical protein
VSNYRAQKPRSVLGVVEESFYPERKATDLDPCGYFTTETTVAEQDERLQAH